MTWSPLSSGILLGWALVVGTAVLSGCVGAGQSSGSSRATIQRNSNDNGDLICHQEYPTGSHIGRTVCRSTDERDRDREQAREFITTPRRPTRPTRPLPQPGI